MAEETVGDSEQLPSMSSLQDEATLSKTSSVNSLIAESSLLSILELPDSILLHIFAYLPFSTIGAVAQVCRAWNCIASDDLLWRHVFLKHYHLALNTSLVARATSWRSEFKRLHYHTPAILSETRKEHKDEVLHVSFSHNGTMFATCSKDGFFKVWACTHPCPLLFKRDMKSTFNWQFTQFSQFNESDTCILVSGVYFSPRSTSGEIAVFNLLDNLEMQCRVTNKPYDVFGAWYDNYHLLSGTLYWTSDLSSVSAVWLSKSSQEVESEVESVSMVMYRFENINNSSIRLLQVAEVGRDVKMTRSYWDKDDLDSSKHSSLSESEGREDLQRWSESEMLSTEPHDEKNLLHGLLSKCIAEDEFDIENEDKTDDEDAVPFIEKTENFCCDWNSHDKFDYDTLKAADNRNHNSLRVDSTCNQPCPDFSSTSIDSNSTKSGDFMSVGHDAASVEPMCLCSLNSETPKICASSVLSPISCCSTTDAMLPVHKAEICHTPFHSVPSANDKSRFQSSFEDGNSKPDVLSSNGLKDLNVDMSPLFNGTTYFSETSLDNEQHMSWTPNVRVGRNGEGCCDSNAETVSRDNSVNEINLCDGVCSKSVPATEDLEMEGTIDTVSSSGFCNEAVEDECDGTQRNTNNNYQTFSGAKELHRSCGHHMERSANAATQTEILTSSSSSYQSLGHMTNSIHLSPNKSKAPREKLLIYTWGSKTYIPHKIGFKRMLWSDFNKGEVTARQSSMLLPDVMENLQNMAEDRRRDVPDVSIEMDGHIVGLSLAPDHRYLYVNYRPWPPNYVISDPHNTPPLAQEVEISCIDLSTFAFVGPVLRSHKAYTHSDECFFLNLDVSEEFVVSGAEDKQGYMWERNYGILLSRFPHENVVNCAAINPCDPEMVVTVSDDHTFKVWRSRRRWKEITGCPL